MSAGERGGDEEGGAGERQMRSRREARGKQAGGKRQGRNRRAANEKQVRGARERRCSRGRIRRSGREKTFQTAMEGSFVIVMKKGGELVRYQLGIMKKICKQ